MKVGEAIALVDRQKPNKFSAEEKYRWLSEIDGLIVRELIDTHEGSPLSGAFTGYQIPDDEKTELLAPFPYDKLYRWYLESKIDLGNMEIGKYNNSNSLFNSAYLTFSDHYNRTHMPRQVSGFIFTQRREVTADALDL